MENNIAIIGAGPAGLTSAIYLLRAGYNVTVFEKGAPGGKVNNTSFIENYPGVDRISGPDLAYNLYSHAINMGCKIKSAGIISLEKIDDNFVIKTRKDEFIYKAVIIASGMHERKLECENSEKFEHKGISYCAVCDGSFYKDKVTCVIGGGESAFKEAIYLKNICSEVYLIHRRSEFRVNDNLVEQAKQNGVKFILDSVVSKVNGNDKLESIEIKNVLTENVISLNVDGVFPYLGAIPNTDFISIDSVKDSNGFLLCNEKMETSIAGLFGAGDVIKKDLRQIVTATSDGAIAAINAIEYLKRNR